MAFRNLSSWRLSRRLSCSVPRHRHSCFTRQFSTVGDSNESNARTQLLEESLLHLGKHGWSNEAVAAGALSLGISPMAHGVLQNPASDLIYYWMDKGTENMEHFIAKENELPQSTSLREEQIIRLSSALKFRLQHSIPVIRTWHQAMANGAFPTNATETVARLDRIADLACRYGAGIGPDLPGDGFLTQDESSMQWVGQRAMVLTVYSTAELFMLTDYSENFQDTWDFVDRQVNSMAALTSASTSASSLASAVGQGLLSIATGVASVLQPPGLGSTSAAQGASSIVDGAREASFQLAQRTGSSGVVQAVSSLDQVLQQTPLGTTAQVPHQVEEGGAMTVSAVPSGESLEPVRLPNGLSLFGLTSMEVKEASGTVRKENPGFDVVEWPAGKAYVPTTSTRLVRLLHDENGIVVDVSRM